MRDKTARGEIPSLRVGVGPRAPIRIEADELEQGLSGLSSPKPAAGGATSPSINGASSATTEQGSWRRLTSTNSRLSVKPSRAAATSSHEARKYLPITRPCSTGPDASARCPRSEEERQRNTVARGYGPAHKALRRRWAAEVAEGEVRCARCVKSSGAMSPGPPSHARRRAT